VSAASPSGLHKLVLAFGSNLGDRLANLQQGLNAVCAGPEIVPRVVSPVYETLPVGGPAQPDYYNAVLLAAAAAPPRAVLARCQAAEQALHRVRKQRFGPRTLDVDVIVYGQETSGDPELTLPHPRAHQRAFVLAPWHDVDPDARIPGHGAVADLLAQLGTSGVRQLRDVQLRLPA
jgi:2-amino-4-hydroxy-6-hydroxymethyldihydropteridine diphosphokinase